MVISGIDETASAPMLTTREREVLRRLATGRTARAIARDLGSSEGTVRKHLEHVYVKLDVHDRLEAVMTATRIGLMEDAAGSKDYPTGGVGRTVAP